jgi:CRP/FNR family cyclic AMP-dependent transcriptional regulator
VAPIDFKLAASGIWNGSDRVAVAAVDADLVSPADRAHQDRLIRASLARAIHVTAGPWEPAPASGLGLLVLDGVLQRRTQWDQRVAGELLGRGDLVRPGAAPDPEMVIPTQVSWSVVSPARLAILDRTWVARMAPWPDVAMLLMRRALDRSARAAELMAVDQVRRLDLRVWLVLWRLADRFGHVRTDGVYIALPLTHQQLAELAGARRPSVSAAISRLTRAGAVRQLEAGWLLHGTAPVAERDTARFD